MHAYREEDHFEAKFVSKGNNAVRYEFLNKMKAMQSKVQKSKSPIGLVSHNRAHTTEISSTINMMKQKINYISSHSNETDHVVYGEEPTFNKLMLKDRDVGSMEFVKNDIPNNGNQKRTKKQIIHSVFPE
jgi:hypothetical protein